MKIGLYHTNVGALATPAFGRLPALAEELGYDSLWTAEHIVLPDLPPGPQTAHSGTMPYLDPIVALAYLAAHTHRMKLVTGVLLLPHHHPLLLAKQLASLDLLSGGWLIVGIGVGGTDVGTDVRAGLARRRLSERDDRALDDGAPEVCRTARQFRRHQPFRPHHVVDAFRAYPDRRQASRNRQWP
jgi:alkanesulfonate monooxygenase SsuD/methylene tetrahydromethanopterin reductase-like flavin-dependent oxidoreductase (luciferase family)